MTFPRMDSVWALYALQKSMMLTPCGPRAVPTGGAGVAAPAWSCTLTSAAIFFFGGIALSLFSRGHDGDLPLPLVLPCWCCLARPSHQGFETCSAFPLFIRVCGSLLNPTRP